VTELLTNKAADAAPLVSNMQRAPAKLRETCNIGAGKEEPKTRLLKLTWFSPFRAYARYTR
jgi:hypothetical protein